MVLMVVVLLCRALLLSALLRCLPMVRMRLGWDCSKQAGAKTQAHGEQEGMHCNFTPCELTG